MFNRNKSEKLINSLEHLTYHDRTLDSRYNGGNPRNALSRILEIIKLGKQEKRRS